MKSESNTYYYILDHSPDFRYFAFYQWVKGEEEPNFYDLYIYDQAQNTVRPLITETSTLENYPVFSPDSRMVAFTSSSGPPYWFNDIYIYDLNNDSLQRITFDEDINFEYELIWSPDGSTLAYISGDFVNLQNIHNGENTQLFSFLPYENLSKLSWSPDSEKMAFLVSDGTGRPTYQYLYMYDLSTNTLSNLTEGYPFPEKFTHFFYAWAADSSKIYINLPVETFTNIFEIDIEIQKITRITQPDKSTGFENDRHYVLLGLSVDGKYLIYHDGRTKPQQFICVIDLNTNQLIGKLEFPSNWEPEYLIP